MVLKKNLLIIRTSEQRYVTSPDNDLTSNRRCLKVGKYSSLIGRMTLKSSVVSQGKVRSLCICCSDRCVPLKTHWAGVKSCLLGAR